MLKKLPGRWNGYLFLFPAVIYMLALIGYPLLYNLILSFQNVDLQGLNTGESSLIGFDNYMNLFQDSVFWISVKNTLLYTVGSVVFQFVIGFLLALFFSMKFRLASFLRGIMMVSWLIPLTISALLFRFMMGADGGIFNQFLLSIGIIENPIPWLTSPQMALWSVVLANIWVGIPFNMLLLSTGLSNLPEDIYESASLDGASIIQKFFHITVPLLRPVILVVMMLGFIYTFKVFDLIFVMTGGGPVNATEVLSTLSYQYSFSDFEFSMGAATANILFLILFVVSLVYLKMIKNDEVM
ncbi:carbohydrate ABC transporter permease [Salibacterium qingdaonense]|uniref:Carbohydrate ABC transporter membrane protein 1, CUT1 family (TC 3.A.1.1.-) n=1 Tax=Salibacterium qingdaonense TaxID=266892 RepID=A0A1I4P636_9BACI|nr:sugar ABC transporter permease [Salibacterium qingdaonense]SFM23189.1 carbohydrate ABC transporter membrane protein 1, CUT1 family (TC 3.A.1.1.-) [Salibacterium qingdaonense]